MYSLIKNGNTIKTVEYVRSIRKQNNGCYVLCRHNERDGINAGGQVYMNDEFDSIEQFDGSNKLNDIATLAKEQIQANCIINNTPPSVDTGKLQCCIDVWEAGKTYNRFDLFSYNGSVGWVKQAHTSQETWLPFSAGTEALYGARPVPDDSGVYPYVYNMKVEVGMKVYDDGVVYECIQGTDELLYKPAQVPALFRVM